MSHSWRLRETQTSDLPALRALYDDAFAGTEELMPLVTALLGLGDAQRSLVAGAGAEVIGHVALVRCAIPGRRCHPALLGPLAVARAHQRSGVGSALVRAGLAAERDRGTDLVYVLGDPAYYARFGFAPGAPTDPPYPVPEAWRPAWQVVRLGQVEPPAAATLAVPAPWQVAAYWGP